MALPWDMLAWIFLPHLEIEDMLVLNFFLLRNWELTEFVQLDPKMILIDCSVNHFIHVQKTEN